MLKVGAIGREIQVPLFDDPKPVLEGQGEDAFTAEMLEWSQRQGVKLRAKLVGRSTFRKWAYTYDRITAEMRARIRERQKTTTAEDDPNLYAEGYVDERAAEETDELMKSVVKDTAIELIGVEVDGLDPAAYKDPPRIADALEHAGLLPRAFAVLLKAQNPDRKEVFC
jgi:hypothetical protein